MVMPKNWWNKQISLQRQVTDRKNFMKKLSGETDIFAMPGDRQPQVEARHVNQRSAELQPYTLSLSGKHS